MFLNDILGLDGERNGENFVHQKQELVFEDVEDQHQDKRMKVWRVMDAPELSLGLPQFVAQEGAENSLAVTEINATRKRKLCGDSLNSELAFKHASIELQAAGSDPLPLDWEQCLDLESGKVYYLNRKTLKKSCSWPKDQKLDLELKISTFSVHVGRETTISEMNHSDKTMSSMVAVACQKCHLLVMLSRSSPSCPNCKHVHSFPTIASTGPKITSMKSLETLSLLN